MSASAPSSSSKKTLGRQKIEMVKIEDEGSMFATFSKRKAGIFKKANDLSTLCGVELAVVIKSPGNNFYCFGNPGAEEVIARYLLGDREPPEPSEASQLIEARRRATVQQLGTQITEVRKVLAEEKKRAKEFDEMKKEGRVQNWFERPKDELCVEQLQQLKVAMRDLQMEVEMLYFQKESIPSTGDINLQQHFVGSSSSQGANPNFETTINDGMPSFNAMMMMMGNIGVQNDVPNMMMAPPAPEHNPMMDEGYQNMIAPPPLQQPLSSSLPPLPPSMPSLSSSLPPLPLSVQLQLQLQPLSPSRPAGPPMSPLPALPETWDEDVEYDAIQNMIAAAAPPSGLYEGYDIVPNMTAPPPQGYNTGIGYEGRNIVPTPPSGDNDNPQAGI